MSTSQEFGDSVEPDIKDDLTEFLKLDFNQRIKFFDFVQGDSDVQNQKNQKTLRCLKKIMKELQRVDDIRELIGNDEKEKHLVDCIIESREAWMKSSDYKFGIEPRLSQGGVVNNWSKRQEFLESPTPSQLQELSAQFKKNSQSSHASETPAEDTRTPTTQTYKPEEDFKAYVIQYEYDKTERLEKSDHHRAEGHFPDQRLPVKELLGDTMQGSPRFGDFPKSNLLFEGPTMLPNGKPTKEGSKIRYFHLPANNMAWAERAMALFYNEKDAVDPGNRPNSKPVAESRTYTLLRSEYWRGQQQGDLQTPVHARHMRPLCETVSSSIVKDGVVNPKNVVLFMPYLHWETDRKRNSFATFIDELTIEEEEKHQKRQMKERQDEIDKRKGLEKPGRFADNLTDKSRKRTREIISKPSRSFPSTVDNMNLQGKRLRTDENGRLNIRSSTLGQYLIDAARLYEGISNYRDKDLLRKYLYADPPIHPRRTLDQSYYWSLNTTRSRDRDQVVYRGTRAAVENLHQFDMENQVWAKHEEDRKYGRDRKGYDDDRCLTCHSNIRKVARLVMVDQLWMWVLDANTIVTLFPRRYGTNKNDITGVHKSIRTRLHKISRSGNRENLMGSVWDLALIIFDECTNTFFDRTRTPDRQPQIIDDFSEAIGNVTNKQTLAFDRLWAWTEHWKENYRAGIKSKALDLHFTLLDINPEGKLQREIKDIIEELEIMIHINKTHKTMLKSFTQQVINILDPRGQLKPKFHNSRLDREYHDSSKQEETDSVRTNSGFADATEYDRFLPKAEELLVKVTSRIEELEELRRSAQSTSDSIKDLLALKQQQASVVQAWQSAQQAEEAVSQGRSIMIFTVVTIVFAPLSFMSSIFGMNAFEFSPSQNTWPIIQQLIYVLPISFGIIIVVLAAAFSPYARTLSTTWFYRVTTDVLLAKFWPGRSLYKLWYSRQLRTGDKLDMAIRDANRRKKAARNEVLDKQELANAKRTMLEEEQKRKEGHSSSTITEMKGDGSTALVGMGTAQPVPSHSTDVQSNRKRKWKIFRRRDDHDPTKLV